MQIAQIAPLTEAIPPKLYGGTERVISWLTDELVALGHDVVLFASGDSETSANLEACWPKALRLDGSVRDPNALHMAVLEQVRQRAHDFDLLHFHLDYYPFSLFSRQSTPFVTTLHGRLDLPEHQVVFATFPSIPVISISDAQRRPVSRAGWIRTIHHGLPERLLTPQPITPTYFAFLGRISPEKAVDQAIWIAKRSGIPLKIAAKVDAVDRDYFESEIRKLLASPQASHKGQTRSCSSRPGDRVGRGKGRAEVPSLRAPLGVSGSPRSSSLATAARCYGVQHHRYPLGSIVHDLPVREFTMTVEPV